MCQYGTPASPVSRTYLYGSMIIRHRVGYVADGQGVHGGAPHAETFNSSFWSQCYNLAGNVNHYSVYFGPGRVDWFGEVGTVACKAGMHALGRALDLTRVQFVGYGFCDMNYSWRPQRALWDRRRYLAVAAGCRRNFGTVLTAWYNSAHHNHIHVDNGAAVGPIKSGLRSDTTLVQSACNLLNGESLAVDGAWGSLTNAAYGRLISRFNMGVYNPRAYTSHALYFLEFIIKHGFKNVSAGTYRA